MAYSLVWRTLAEAITIRLTGFVLGTLGGLTGLRPWGVLGAGLVGLLIGRAHKRTIGSRPVGTFHWWQKLRPWLGLFGGLGFGILGLFVGWSIAKALGITL